ncbi:MAG: nicotinamide riboside transporter PnuC [Burkholderiales bacterium]|nr:nicotinamide riboside transporter PnuC [Burkholderiales bacterium]
MFEFINNAFSIKTILYHFNWGSGYDLSYIEAIGTIFGLLCIWYAGQEKRFNFYFGLINVTLFAIIFYQIQLYANLLLQIFFWVMNVYGLYAWGRSNSAAESLKIRWLTSPQLVLTIIGSLLAIALLAIYINPFFNGLTIIAVKLMQLVAPNLTLPTLQADPDPLMDAAVTVLSIVAMVQMTRKLVENWLLWVVINLISIVLYAKQGVYFMALEYIILTFIALNGSLVWIKAARQK